MFNQEVSEIWHKLLSPWISNHSKLSHKTLMKKEIILKVRSKKDYSTCHKCGKHATKPHGKAPKLTIRHLPILDTPVYLVIYPIRYQCEHCDDHPTTTEQYDWVDRRSTTSKGLDKYIARSLIHSTSQDVSIKEGLAYDVVVSAIDRQVKQEVDWSEYVDLEDLGIDEISMKRATGLRDYCQCAHKTRGVISHCGSSRQTQRNGSGIPSINPGTLEANRENGLYRHV